MFVEDTFISTLVETYVSLLSMFQEYASVLGGYEFESIEYIFMIFAFVIIVIFMFKFVITLFRWLFDF